MDSQQLLADLTHSLKSGNTKPVCGIILKNPEILNHPDVSEVRRSLLVKAANDKVIAELLVNLPKCIKSEDNVNLEEQLVLAIIAGNVKMAKLMLKNGAKLEGPEWNGYSTLYRSLFNPVKIKTRKEMLLLLIKYGMNTKVRNGRHENLLHQFIKYSLIKGDYDAVDVAEILINSGVSADAVDVQGYTPLLLATEYENDSVVSFLIKKGANVNVKSRHEGLFPLFFATQCGNEDLVRLLLSNGADVNAKTHFGIAALHRACIYSNEKMICLLIRKGADISAQDKNGRTPFSVLKPAKNNYDRCLKTMVKEFAKLILEKRSVHEKDMKLIRVNPKAREYFEKCTRELEEMASTKFYEHYSYYSVLKMTKNIVKLAHLTKNNEFLEKFKTNLRNFSYYKDDLQSILEEAFQLNDRIETIRYRLYFIFDDFLPDIVMRKLSRYLTLEDLPLH